MGLVSLLKLYFASRRLHKSMNPYYMLAVGCATGLFIGNVLTVQSAEAIQKMIPPDNQCSNIKNKVLILFYLGLSPTYETPPLYITDILKWPTTHDGEMENNHRYIQWIFPTKTSSKSNPRAPILDEEIASVLVEINLFRKNYALCFFKFMRFLNIELNSIDDFDFTIRIDPVMFFRHAKKHNFLRLSRVLESLLCFGYRKLATDLYSALDNLEEEGMLQKDMLQIFKDSKEMYWQRIMEEFQFPWSYSSSDTPYVHPLKSSASEIMFYHELSIIIHN
jgi:hypothetical protein